MRDAHARAALPAQGAVFVYSGNGCQWEGMGRDLLATSGAFAAAMDRVDALFQRRAGFSLRAELMGDNNALNANVLDDNALGDNALDESALHASALGPLENSSSAANAT
ncbi:MAG TPA: acyltransferase domain-containing protein, partial [Halomonas sp.]|nr:acyltransferase domain-containing protein [Halomonas sp.]